VNPCPFNVPTPSTVRRLTEGWQEEHARWQRRDLSARRYVYLWADGVYFTPRLEHERQCLLVLIGDELRSRTDERRATEVAVAAHALNRMLELGRSNYVRVA
jgi:hypothetical protein